MVSDTLPASTCNASVTAAAWLWRATLARASCAIRSSAYRRRRNLLGAPHLQGRPDPALTRPVGNVGLQRLSQARVIEGNGPQLMDHQRQFGAGVLGELFRFEHMRPRGMRIAIQQHPRCAELHDGGEHLLLDAVMQIPREPVALGGNRQLLPLPLRRLQAAQQLLIFTPGQRGRPQGVAEDAADGKDRCVKEHSKECCRAQNPDRHQAGQQPEERDPGRGSSHREHDRDLHAEHEVQERETCRTCWSATQAGP